MSTRNLCFRAKIRKNVYPCTPQFYYTKVGRKGVFVTRTCFRDVSATLRHNRIIWMPFLFDLVNRDRVPVKFIALMNLCFGCQHIKWT